MSIRQVVVVVGLTGLVSACAAAKDPHLSIDLSRSAPLPPREREISLRGIAELRGPCVVVVEGEKKQGSGFFVPNAPWVATNAHVVKDEKRLIVRTPEGKKLEVRRVVVLDAEHDLALIEVPVGRYPAVTLGSDDSVHVGDKVVAIGAPLGLEQTVSEGNVSAIREDSQGQRILQISVPISHGSSGGALFDSRGQLIGITTAGIEEGQNLNFALPVGLLAALLSRARAATAPQ